MTLLTAAESPAQAIPVPAQSGNGFGDPMRSRRNGAATALFYCVPSSQLYGGRVGRSSDRPGSYFPGSPTWHVRHLSRLATRGDGSSSKNRTVPMSKFYVTQVPSADANPVGFVTTAFYEDRDQTPPPVSALREMFVSLWTHLDEVSWRANALSKSRDELSDSMRSGLAGIAKIADVGAVYGSMQRILAEETSKQAERLDHSRARMADLIAENAKLRMELAEARGGKGVH